MFLLPCDKYKAGSMLSMMHGVGAAMGRYKTMAGSRWSCRESDMQVPNKVGDAAG